MLLGLFESVNKELIIFSQTRLCNHWHRNLCLTKLKLTEVNLNEVKSCLHSQRCRTYFNSLKHAEEYSFFFFFLLLTSLHFIVLWELLINMTLRWTEVHHRGGCDNIKDYHLSMLVFHEVRKNFFLKYFKVKMVDFAVIIVNCSCPSFPLTSLFIIGGGCIFVSTAFFFWMMLCCILIGCTVLHKTQPLYLCTGLKTACSMKIHTGIQSLLTRRYHVYVFARTNSHVLLKLKMAL